MAKNSKGKASGLPKGFGGIATIVYALILALGGMFLWMYLNPKIDNCIDKAIEFDNHLSEDLVRAGLTDLDIAVQFRLEKADKRAVWIEFNKEVLVATSDAKLNLAQAVAVTAQKYGLTTTETKQDFKLIVTALYHNRALSRLSIVPRRLTGIDLSPTTPTRHQKPKKKVAIVIDDVGAKADVSAFLDLNVPLTLAIMPWERHSRDIAGHLSRLKIPYIMHLPMQPEGFPKVDPGKSALLLSMSDEQVRNMFASDFGSVPGIAGVSNHMGSAYSADEPKMRKLLAMIKEHSLFYLDSFTSPKSKARVVQKSLGMPLLRNDIFLDDDDNPAYIRRQLQILLKQANRYGRAIAIGHFQRKNLVAALKEFIPECKKSGIEFVYLTGMIE